MKLEETFSYFEQRFEWRIWETKEDVRLSCRMHATQGGGSGRSTPFHCDRSQWRHFGRRGARVRQMQGPLGRLFEDGGGGNTAIGAWREPENLRGSKALLVPPLPPRVRSAATL